MLKPVLPLLQNEVAHLFWKAEHIATVHHHHGNHHEALEVTEAAKNNDSDKDPVSSKTSDPVSVHLVTQPVYHAPTILIEALAFQTTASSTSTLHLDKIYPPPKALMLFITKI